MLLIATMDDALAKLWQSALSSEYTFHETVATDKRQLAICMKKLPIEVVLLHLPLLGSEGVTAISGLQELQPTSKVIIIAPVYDEREELTAVLFGAKAYLEDNIKMSVLLKVVQKVLLGEVWVDRMFVTRLLKEIQEITKVQHQDVVEIERGMAMMTPREEQIAELIATGASNRRIAEKLTISERTVKAHLGVIFRKIGITDRLQLALYVNKYHQIASMWHHSTEPAKSSRKE